MGEATNNLLKALVGVVIMVIGIAWYTRFWPSLVTVVAGSAGAVIFLIGLLYAWMNYEDYKMAKETSKKSE